MSPERKSTLSRIAGEGAERSEAGEEQRRRRVTPIPVGALMRARALRRNSTDTERRLWAALRSRQLRGYKFRRQMPIGDFVGDFACTKYLFSVEADGSPHAKNERDARRTCWLESRGWHVLRFWDNDILENIEAVSEVILSALRKRETLALPRLRRGPLPLPQRGRGPSSAEPELSSDTDGPFAP